MPGPVLLDGKRPRRRRQLISVAGGGTLLFLKDDHSGHNYLVDTGAARSILPHRSSAPPSGPLLEGAGGQTIPAWGCRQHVVHICGRKLPFNFVLAAVTRPILGCDFLAAHRLLVDPARQAVLDANTLTALSTSTGRASSLLAVLSPTPPSIRELLARFPQVFAAPKDQLPAPLHGTEHTVETLGRPVFAKARRLDPDRLKAARAEFSALEAAGIIRRSNSKWSSPLHMVRKQDGSWRPCGDYRRLNNITQHDRYPLPNLQDFAANLHGCTVFSKIDLKKGYHQIPMAAADIEKTAIVTPFGLYEYIRMPFGLKNAAQTFQRLMDHLFRDKPFVFIYLDDMIIASRTTAEHHHHLEEIFAILQANGLVANTEKCAFGQPEVEFLGHQVSAGGLVPLPRHIDAIKEFPPPSDIKGLQRFLGMLNFFRRFIPSAAAILRPLTDVLVGKPKKLPWSPPLQAAFESAKAALAAATPLAHPDTAAELALATDASDIHIGGVLQQRQGSGWAPLAFFSQKLSATQQRYSTFDRELLAAFSAIRHFRFMLEGRSFQLQTDHRPLIAAAERVSPPWSGRQQRQLAYISEFTADIRYVPGGDNIVADALSRPTSPPSPAPQPPAATGRVLTAAPPAAQPPAVAGPALLIAPSAPQPPAAAGRALLIAPSAPQPPAAAGRAPVCAATDQSPLPPVDFTDMAVRQLLCPSVAEMKKSPSLQLATVPLVGVDLVGDTSTGSFRPLVPVPLRRQVFDGIHGAAHPGARATRRLVSARFVWPGLAKDVTTWARSCLACQRTKVQRHVHLPPEAIPVPDRRFAHIHVDLVGPLPPSGGFSHLFTIIDRATRWFEALPVAGTTAADCAAALFGGWITRFGVPSSITSDRGAQFCSTLWSSLCKLLNIQHISTTSYHPQGNGLVERQHRRLKDALRARATSAAWIQDLPWVLLGMRAAPREDNGLSAAEAVFGAPLVLPGQFLHLDEPAPSDEFFQDLKLAMSGFSPPPARHNISASQRVEPQLPADLAQADYVLVRRDGHRPPLGPAYDGPYQVLARSLHYFKLQLGERVDNVSTHRLKAAYLPAGAVPAVPPRRGRPPSAAPSPPAAPAPLRGRPRRVKFDCRLFTIPAGDYSPPADYFKATATSPACRPASSPSSQPPSSRTGGE